MSKNVFKFEDMVGNPLSLWNALKNRVQQEDLKQFSDAATSWKYSGASISTRSRASDREEWAKT